MENQNTLQNDYIGGIDLKRIDQKDVKTRSKNGFNRQKGKAINIYNHLQT